MWFLKKRFWNWMTTFKFRNNKPARIPVPRESQRKLGVVSLSCLMPEIPIPNIVMADRIPADELSPLSRLKQFVYDVQRKLLRLIPPMQKGLPPIDADPWKALGEAYTPAHRKLFAPPELPAEYTGALDLGRLAVASPYSVYLERTPEGGYHWDFLRLGRYEHHEGLRSLAVRVLFRVDAPQRRLQAVRIDSEAGHLGSR